MGKRWAAQFPLGTAGEEQPGEVLGAVMGAFGRTSQESC